MNYAIGILREEQEPYFWPMPLEEIDYNFTNYSKEQILSEMKKNDSTLKEENAEKLQIMKRISEHKYITERHTPIITNKNYLNYDITPYLMNDQKIVNILRTELIPFQKRKVSFLLKRMMAILNDDVSLFCELFPHLAYEEKRIIWTKLSRIDKVARQLDNNNIEVLHIPSVKLQRKAS